MNGGQDATLAELESVLGRVGVRPSSPCGDCGGGLWRQAKPAEADEMERRLGVPANAAAAVFWVCLICGNMCMIRFEFSPTLEASSR